MRLTKVTSLAALALLLAHCGSEDKPKKKTTVYATLITENATAENATSQEDTFKLTKATCSANEFGFFEGSFTKGDNSSLHVAITGFTQKDATYNCSQATDNSSGEVDGNLKFNECGVNISLPASADDETYNSYATYRSSSDVKNYSYSGECSVTISYESPTVTGKVNCEGLVQTHFEGAPRNPIDEDTTLDVSSTTEFSCDI